MPDLLARIYAVGLCATCLMFIMTWATQRIEGRIWHPPALLLCVFAVFWWAFWPWFFVMCLVDWMQRRSDDV